jgi:hypothetical protein
MWRMLDIILFTLAPLNRREYLVAQLIAVSPPVIWVLVHGSRALAGFPFFIFGVLTAVTLAYSFAFSIRRLLDIGIETKAKAFLCILGYHGVSNILAMGIGKSILPVTYCVYYGGLVLIPSAKPRPMWTQDLRA